MRGKLLLMLGIVSVLVGFLPPINWLSIIDFICGTVMITLSLIVLALEKIV